MLARSRLSILAAGAGLGAVTIASVALVSQGFAGAPASRPIASLAEAPSPPALPYEFISSDGRFTVSLWDDRALSPAQKAADPWVNPAWGPFAGCMEKEGYVLLAPGQPASQETIDALLARLNRENPDAAANRQILAQSLSRAQGEARAFLACASAWLTKSPKEIYELTGVPNNWYPPQAAPSPAGE